MPRNARLGSNHSRSTKRRSLAARSGFSVTRTGGFSLASAASEVHPVDVESRGDETSYRRQQTAVRRSGFSNCRDAALLTGSGEATIGAVSSSARSLAAVRKTASAMLSLR